MDRVILGLEEIMSKIKNVHKVPASQWRKWNQQQRALFNGTFEDITNVGQELFLPTTTFQRHLSDEEFRIIAWNAAWTAAHILNGQFTTEMTTLYQGQVIAVDKITQRKAA